MLTLSTSLILGVNTLFLDNLHGDDGDEPARRVTTGWHVPSCLFIDPELARVGLTEREAQARGIAYRLASIPMANIMRAHTLGETRGFMKALIEPGTNRVLGFTAFGAEAGEVMPAVQVAIAAGLPYTHLRDMVIAHPTVGEGLGDLFDVPLTDPAPFVAAQSLAMAERLHGKG